MADLIDLTGAPLVVPAAARQLIRECWREASARVDLLAPAAPLGLPRLRAALGRLLGDDPQDILVTAGVRASVAALGDRLQHTTVEAPSFEDIPTLLRSFGYVVERRQWEHFDDRGRGDAAWVTHPSRNPDGACLSESDWERLRAGAWRTVVINETYRWYGAPTAGPAPEGSFFVGSFSKLLGPGVRLGWLRGPTVASVPVPATRISAPPPVVQYAWADFLDHGGVSLMGPALTQVTAGIAAFRRATAGRLLERRSGSGPSLLAVLPEGCSAEQGVAKLARAGLSVGSGDRFGATEPSVRLCFSTTTPDTAEEAGRRFATAL